MTPTTTQALEIFCDRDQVRGNLSILTCTEEEEVQDYFDAEWDDLDITVASLTPSASVEAVWGSCATSDTSSVLGGCTTPTTPSKSAIPRRLSCMSLSESRSPPKTAPLYRPSELGIGFTSNVGDPRDAENISKPTRDWWATSWWATS